MGSKEEEEEEEDKNQTRNATEHKFRLFSRTRIQKKLVACSSYELERKNENCIYCRNMKGMGTEKGGW